MDDTDGKILERLKQNARRPYTDIADELEVSEGTVRNRVEKLQEDGVIEKFTVELSNDSFKAVAMFKVSAGSDIPELISKLPDDMEVNEVAGDYDLVITFSRPTPERLNSVLDRIRETEGVESSKTYTVLKTTKK